jgi:hypothetical protein
MTTTSTGHQLHTELLDQLEAVRQWWPDASQATVSALNAREVLVHLTELRDSLKDHFAIEEEHGLLPDDSTSDPRLNEQANHLLEQHKELFERLNAMIASVPATSENPSLWSVSKGHFEDFRKELERHERAEIEVVQAASGDSFGVVD